MKDILVTTALSVAIRFPADLLVQELELRHRDAGPGATRRRRRYDLRRAADCTFVYTVFTNPVCMASLSLTRAAVAPLRAVWAPLPCYALQAALMLLTCTTTSNLGYLWLYEWVRSRGDAAATARRFRHDAPRVLTSGLGYWGLVHFCGFALFSRAAAQRMFQLVAGFAWAMYMAFVTNRHIGPVSRSGAAAPPWALHGGPAARPTAAAAAGPALQSGPGHDETAGERTAGAVGGLASVRAPAGRPLSGEAPGPSAYAGGPGLRGKEVCVTQQTCHETPAVQSSPTCPCLRSHGGAGGSRG